MTPAEKDAKRLQCLRHIHLTAKRGDPNTVVPVECFNTVCWAIGENRGNRITG